MAAVRWTPSGVPVAIVRLTNLRTVATHRLVTMAAAFTHNRFEFMHTQNPSITSIADLAHTEHAGRYTPLSTNFSSSPSLFIDTQAGQSDLQECASIRISAATDLLESLTCMSISNTCDQDLRRVVNAAYLLLRDGVDLMAVARR